MSIASGRAVARLAWRTARRHPARTTLIGLLIGIAVMVSVGAGIVVRTSSPTRTEEIAAYFGTAELNVELYGYSEEAVAWIEDELASVVPDAEVARLQRAWGWRFELLSADLTAPMLEGKYEIIDGRPPSDGEVVLSWRYARDIDLSVGDTWSPAGTDHSWTVAATAVEFESGASRSFVLAPEEEFEILHQVAVTDLGKSPRQVSWLVAGDFDQIQAQRRISDDWGQAAPALALAPVGPYESDLSVQARIWWEDDAGFSEGLGSEPSAISAMVSALLLVEIALLAAAAYATGIRRRLREIGLAATQGATPRQLSGTVISEAAITGLLGAMAGTAVAIGAALALQPLVQRHWNPTIDSINFAPSDAAGPIVIAVVAAVLAAWWPARTASKIPVLAALQGRMTVRRPPRWIIPASLALVAIGLVLLVVATASSGRLAQAQAVVAVAMVLSGGILIGLPLVTGVGRLAHRLPIAGRVVARDSARQSVKASSAIATLMVVLVGSVAAATAVATSKAVSDATGQGDFGGDPRFVYVRGDWDEDGWEADPRYAPVSQEDEAQVAELVPSADRFEIATLGGTPILGSYAPLVTRSSDESWYDGYFCHGDSSNEYCISMQAIHLPPAVASEGLFEQLGIPEAESAYTAGTPVLLGTSDGPVTIDYDGEVLEVVSFSGARNPWSLPVLYVTEEWAQERGLLDDARRTVLFINDEPLSGEERQAVWDTQINASVGMAGIGITTAQTLALIVAGALFLIVVVIAIVVGLSATESDKDVGVMVAVGAAPALRRGFLGRQSGLYVASAAAIAIPLGLLLMWVTSSDHIVAGRYGVWDGGIVVPWMIVAVLLVVAPLVVGSGTALLVRSLPARPPRRVG